MGLHFDKNRISAINRIYPYGTRVELVSMADDPRPVPPGTRGTVVGIDDMGHLLMQWDNGSTLKLIWGVDDFNKIYEE